MMHRLREGMRDVSLPGSDGRAAKAPPWKPTKPPIGGKDKHAQKAQRRDPKKIGMHGKAVAFTLVERGGAARSFHVANVTGATLHPIIVKHVSLESTLMTDDAGPFACRQGVRPLRNGQPRH